METNVYMGALMSLSPLALCLFHLFPPSLLRVTLQSFYQEQHFHKLIQDEIFHFIILFISFAPSDTNGFIFVSSKRVGKQHLEGLKKHSRPPNT